MRSSRNTFKLHSIFYLTFEHGLKLAFKVGLICVCKYMLRVMVELSSFCLKPVIAKKAV